MTRLIYHVEIGDSEKNQALVLRKTTNEKIVIPFSKTRKTLEEIAAHGKLFLKEKEIVIDLYGKADIFYLATPDSIQAFIRTSGKEVPLKDCDFICGGPPHFFIKGIILKWITSDISWKDLKKAYQGIYKTALELELESKEDPEAPQLIASEGYSIAEIKEKPWPVLILKDRTGAFADLWMQYGADRVIFQEEMLPSSRRKRQMDLEKAWENDLLETNFIRKQVDNSHYYCPLEKVAKSLAFLIEIGWKVYDSQGKQVLTYKNVDLCAEKVKNGFSIKGKIAFEDFQIDLTQMAGTFNRRESFVQLPGNHVGLLPPNWAEQNGLDLILEEGEIVSDGLFVKSAHFSAFSSLFDSQTQIRLDSSLKNLKERLLSFKGIEITPPGPHFQGTLRPYQQEGLNWLKFLHDYQFHGILADEMGLGKTVQVIAFLSQLKEPEPILIVVPTSLIFNWKKEIQHFLPEAKLHIHHGLDRVKDLSTLADGTIIITSYTTLRLDSPLFSKPTFSCLILDEAQNIKNPRTQIFQAVIKLQSKFRLELTGTPVENHSEELWAHFHFLLPSLLGEETAFASDIQAGASDPRFLTKIKRKIAPFILRRKKEEVAKDLPEKIEQTVWVEMEPQQRQVYEGFLSGIRSGLLKKVRLEGSSKCRMEILEAILRLRQICCHPVLVNQESMSAGSAKLEALIEDLETTVEEGRKALIYSQFTSMLAVINKKIKEKQWPSLYLDGSTVNREKVVQEFQENSSVPFFLISLKAGGIGLNLTAADYVFLYDPWWNEAVENQAIDRAHRIGRKDIVIAKRYVVRESIEEKIMKLKQTKRQLSSELLDEEGNFEYLNTDDLLYFLD